MVAAGKNKRNIKMKKLVVVAMAVSVAFASVAMPTEAEFAKASRDVQNALKAQIVSWQKGDMTDCELAALMLLNAGRFKDEARHYACLQAAFAAAARAGDAALAAKAYERICVEIKGFSLELGEKMIGGALAKVEAKKAAAFRGQLKKERSYQSFAADYTTKCKLDKIMLPSVSIKPSDTLAGAVGLLRLLSREHDIEPKGSGVNFMLSVPEGENPPAVPTINARNIRLGDALKLIADSVGYKFEVYGDTVLIAKKVAAKSKLKSIYLSSFSIKPPSTLADAIELMRKKSVECDGSAIGKGVNFVLEAPKDGKFPVVPRINTGAICLADALKLVVGCVGYDFKEENGIVVVFKKK